MSEQKQSLADFVFENKDKMPDNVYKILMEQYAKQEQQKGFVEIIYLYPKLMEDCDHSFELKYFKRHAIVKKYDNRYKGEEEMKVGLFQYGRICKNTSAPDGFLQNYIQLTCDSNLVLVRDIGRTDCDWEIEKGAEYFNCTATEVFVISVKDL